MKCNQTKFTFITLLLINIINVYSKLLFTFPSSLTLEDENILVIEKNGIYICDPTLENIISTVFTFNEDDIIKDLNSLYNVYMKDKNGFIICLVNARLFFFNRTGTLLKYTNRLINEDNPNYSTLVPIYKDSNFYYYVFGYLDINAHIKFQYYKIRLSDYTNGLIGTFTFNNLDGYFTDCNYLNKGFSCEYMKEKEDNDYNYLVCFFISDCDSNSFTYELYKIKDDSISERYWDDKEKLNNVKLIKTIANNNLKNVLILAFVEDNNNFNIKAYSFYYKESRFTPLNEKLNSLTSPDIYCSKILYGIKTNYIYEKNLINFSCINSPAVYSILYNNDLGVVQRDKQFETCSSIYGHSVIFSKHYNNYYVVSDVICDNKQRTFIPLIGDIPPYEEEKEIEEEKREEKEEEKIEEEIIHEIEKEILKEEEFIFEEEKYEEMIEEKKFEEIVEEIKEEEKFIWEEEIINEETELIIQCPKLEKCSECDGESLLKNLCIKCDNDKGYYLLNVKINKKYIECVNNITKPSNFYFDSENKKFEPCFETCAKCDTKGNYEENNCTSCDEINYRLKPDYEPFNNCVPKCKYLYYYNDYGQYKCTDYPYCPDDYNILISKKYKCTNDCTKEDIYMYYYNGECLKSCPNNTQDDNDFLCKDININNCILSENYLMQLDENITDDEIEKLTKVYAKEFEYTDVHVSIYQNNIYTITIYKDSNCIDNLELQIPEINFGDCGLKVRTSYEIEENLIVAIIDKKIEGTNQRKMISYSLFSPTTGTKLNSESICEDDKLVVLENLSLKLKNSNINLDTFTKFVEQGINVYDLSDPFYTDVCFQYTNIESENNVDKDIALKDRVLVYFPNITLCEDGCDIKGINMTTYKAICECKYTKGKDILKDNALYQSQVGQLEEFISSSNIYVIKCFKNIFNVSYFKQCLGGINFSIPPEKRYKRSLKNIKIKPNYEEEKKASIQEISDKNNDIIINSNYLDLNSQKEENKKVYIKSYKIKDKPHRLILRRHLYGLKNWQTIETSKSNLKSNILSDKDIKKLYSDENKLNNNNDNDKNTINEISSSSEKKPSEKIKDLPIKIYDKPDILQNSSNSSDEEPASKNAKLIKGINFSSLMDLQNLKNDQKQDTFFAEYLQTEFQDMDFEDMLIKDKRDFCTYYYEKLKDDQIIVKIFKGDDPLKPKSILILLLLLQIDLYFLINGLFYDEEYASEVFHLEKDSFGDAMNRFLENLVYSALVGIIIGYIIECFFIEESRMKKIFKKKKDNALEIKYEINQIIKSIQRRYFFFIIITFIITIFTWFHVSCFNVVYPHLKLEWLLFSVIIIIFMQLFSAFICLLHSILRYFSFKCKSEKIYKLSYLLS